MHIKCIDMLCHCGGPYVDMTRDVKAFVKTCDKCQYVNDKFTKPSTQLHPFPVEPEMWQQVYKLLNLYHCVKLLRLNFVLLLTDWN